MAKAALYLFWVVALTVALQGAVWLGAPWYIAASPLVGIVAVAWAGF